MRANTPSSRLSQITSATLFRNDVSTNHLAGILALIPYTHVLDPHIQSLTSNIQLLEHPDRVDVYR